MFSFQSFWAVVRAASSLRFLCFSRRLTFRTSQALFAAALSFFRLFYDGFFSLRDFRSLSGGGRAVVRSTAAEKCFRISAIEASSTIESLQLTLDSNEHEERLRKPCT